MMRVIWQLKVADNGGVLSLGNDIASQNTFVDLVTITPHATATSSEVTVVGQLGYKSKTASVGTTTLTSAQSGAVIMQSTNSAVVTLPATVAGLSTQLYGQVQLVRHLISLQILAIKL